MKFKGQGKINICGFEYKKNIADSRRGGGPSTQKKPVSAPAFWIRPWCDTEICPLVGTTDVAEILCNDVADWSMLTLTAWLTLTLESLISINTAGGIPQKIPQNMTY